MKMTSAEANKLLRKLHDDHSALESMEMESRTFVAATTKKLEDARPEYDYAAVQEKLAELEDKTRYIKDYILEHDTMSFRDLLEKQNSKMEIIVTFLVVLELIKVGIIEIVQDSIFDDILITVAKDAESKMAFIDLETVI